MNKQNQNHIQKEVTEKYEIICMKAKQCCGINGGCNATHHVIPNGSIIFQHCLC